MAEIIKRYPDAAFYGIGGEQMRAQGLQVLYSMDSIALMGVESVLKDLRNILAIRSAMVKHILADKPDCFIGVDVPDFNLSLEKKLRTAGIKVVHYVSPSVWAWRGYRLNKIRLAVDHILTLFPFEQGYYTKRGIPATFVGHPAADKAVAVRQQADTQHREKTIALLPGSRQAEVNSLLPVMLRAAKLLYARYPDMRFILPFASKKLHAQCAPMVQHSGLPIKLYIKQSGQILCEAKLSIVASGTAALEAMIYGSVMVVVYKVGWLSFTMYNILKHVEHFSLPNQLLTEPEIPELAQKQVTAENIFEAACSFLDDPARISRLEQEFSRVADTLHQDTNMRAAEAVLSVLEEPRDAK